MSSPLQQARRDTGSLSSNLVSKPGSQMTMNTNNLMPPQANLFHQSSRNTHQPPKKKPEKEVSLGISGAPKKLISDLKVKFEKRQPAEGLVKQSSLFNSSKTSISKIFSNPHPKVESVIPRVAFEDQDAGMDQCDYQLAVALARSPTHSNNEHQAKPVKSFHSGASMKLTNSQDLQLQTSQSKVRNMGFKRKSKSVTAGILKNKDPAARSVSIKSKKSVKFSSKKTIFKYRQPE